MTAAARKDLPSAWDVSRLLAANIGALVREILPHGRLDRPGGDEWCVAGVHGAPPNKHGSCRIKLRGPKAGLWSDFSTGESGGPIGLVAAVLYRGHRGDAYRYAVSWLGLDGHAPPAMRAAYAPERVQRDASVVAAKKHKSAMRLWLEARPAIGGTPADLYLQARGIDLRRLGRQPGALRFHPACWCEEAGQRLPALLATVVGADGQTHAVHRTWLAVDKGVWGKARLESPKKTLSRPRGGTIRLWRGASGKPIAEAPEGEHVAIGEGIETCLSVAMAVPALRVLCGVSMANMGAVALPPCIGKVTILADNDGENPGARLGLQRVINHFAATITDLRIARAPIGKDFNDCLRVA